MLAAPCIFRPDNATGETEITVCFGRHLPIHWLDGDERTKLVDSLELVLGRPVAAICQPLLTHRLESVLSVTFQMPMSTLDCERASRFLAQTASELDAIYDCPTAISA